MKSLPLLDARGSHPFLSFEDTFFTNVHLLFLLTMPYYECSNDHGPCFRTPACDSKRRPTSLTQLLPEKYTTVIANERLLL